MKKISLIVVLALVLVGAFSAVALADQSHPNNAGVTTAGSFSQGQPGQVYLPGTAAGWDGSPIHSDYAANTDACAACHTPHTAQGDDITQWATGTAGFTDTCMACHDGTVTATYNVEKGDIAGTGVMPDGGKFAVLADQGDSAALASASQHNVTNGIQIGGAAYGGAPTATKDAHGAWTGKFDCTSCHDPHDKGGNSRLLNPNPNGVQTATTQTMTYDAGVNGFAFPNGNRPITGYGSSITVFVNGTTAQTVGGMLFTTNNTMTAANKELNTTEVYYSLANMTNGTGGAVLSTDTVTVKYTPVLRVNIMVNNKLQAGEYVMYDTTIDTFCGACHTDYNTGAYMASGSASTESGTYTQAYRHQVGKAHSVPAAESPGYIALGSAPKGALTLTASSTAANGGFLTCMTCHVAHGVDQSVWAKAAASTGISQFDVPETSGAGTSKLKRLPNMGVCEACHNKEDASYSSQTVTQYMN